MIEVSGIKPTSPPHSALELGVMRTPISTALLWNWTFTGVICDQYDHNNKNWRQNELKKFTLGYGAIPPPLKGVTKKMKFSKIGRRA